MSKILVLAEKPSVGKEIARVLGCKRQCGGYVDGDKYIVTWALGHLVTLEDPEHYGKQYKTWSMETLPMIPPKMDLKVIPETAKQYAVVKGLLKNNDVSSLVIATDAGREGELVARWILAKVGFSKPIKRLWISSQTEKAIKEGFRTLKEGREYLNLYNSAQARAEADWLVGLNATRALTCKYNVQLSAGRVQTPTLAIIAEREEEIKKFRPKDFYTLKVDLGNFFVTWHDKDNQTRIFEKTQIDGIAEKVRNKNFKVESLTKTDKKTPPPALYDLTELQRDANKLYGMSPKETLSVMQRLYETHKALTYPRTDSRYLTDDIVPTLTDRLRAVSKGEFAQFTTEIMRHKYTIAKACINNAKVSDHHAIIPTEQGVDMSKLDSGEKRVYMLVIKRFLTCFYPAYEFSQIRAELSCEKERFYAGGRTITKKGWKAIYDLKDDDEDDEQVLPGIKKGDVFQGKAMQVKAQKTTPPPRYTEATLLTAMENPLKFIEDKSMKEYIGGGLGTPATRADIIEKLFSSFYVEKSGNSIVPTQKGIQLISLVPKELREPELTAKWEQKLEAISKGRSNTQGFISDIKKYTTEVVGNISNSTIQYVHHNVTRTKCPQCGKFMLAVTGKRGKMLVCQDRDCGYKENVSMETNMRCPKCKKKMEIFGDGEKRMYVCSCGFREKADKLHAELAASSPKATKAAVQEYMKKQNKSEEPEMSAFARALAEAMNKK